MAAPKLDDGMHISCDACRLVAQLARTEEAAKRCMVHNDSSARGGVAQRVLDLERQLSRTQANQAEADAKFAREKKRAQDQKARAEELQKRLDAVLRDQRRLVQRVGHAESRRWGHALTRLLRTFTARGLQRAGQHVRCSLAWS